MSSGAEHKADEAPTASSSDHGDGSGPTDPVDDVAWADSPSQGGSAAADGGPNGGPPPAGPDAAGQAGGTAPGEVANHSSTTTDTNAGGPADAGAVGSISVEDLVQDLERVTGERDQYLDASRRLQAELENYRKAVAKRETDARERANEALVAELLPVLDACDGALANGATDVEPVRTALIDALTKQGLDRIEGQDEGFDPALHDAVMHEPAEDAASGPVVAEVMRAGYRWRGRVVRPAMVKVRG